jgi:hypothetical protein
MNQRRIALPCSLIVAGLLIAVLALLWPATTHAQPTLPTRLAPPMRLTPAAPPLRITPVAPLRVTPTPRALRATPVTPAAPCIHLTTDGAAGASFVGGRIAERCFAFPGDAGAVVSIRLTKSGAGATPRMELRGPDGRVVTSSSSGAILNQSLDLDGPYAVVVSGAGMATSVRIEVAVLMEGATSSISSSSEAAALCGGSIASNQELTGIVPFPGEDCRFTFRGQRGQSIGVRMDSLAPDLAPDLVLLDPSGNVLDTGHSLGDRSTYVSALRLPATGVYTVVAGSQGGQSAGAFKLKLRPVQAVSCGASLPIGQLAELQLPAGSVTCDLLVAVPEQRLLAATVLALDGAPAPGWLVFGPQGNRVASDQETTWFADPAGQHLLRLQSSGGQPGRVLVEVVPPPYPLIYIVTSCGANLTYGQSPGTKPFELGLTGSVCLFNFDGVAGHVVWVAVSRASAGSDFDPVVELMAPGYRPADAPEITAYSGLVSGMTVLRDHPLARSGRYTVRVTDYGNDDEGSFYIMVWKR